MRIHVYRVEEGAEAFESLLAAAAARGVRVGWLELRAPAAVDSGLALATAAGAARGVVVGDGCSVAVKRLKGPAVLRDLLREHFLGCRAVLVLGLENTARAAELGAPRLRPSGDDWSLQPPSSPASVLSTAELLDGLRRPP